MISKTAIDGFLWDVEKSMMKTHGLDAARLAYPLYWYVNTGRASCDFLRALLLCKPFVIARILAKGGTENDAINAVCRKIGYQREG